MNTPKISFTSQKLSVPLSAIFPIRQAPKEGRNLARYESIIASIKEIGLVEPLIVFPQKGRADHYLIMDGHQRYFALKELGREKAECIVSTDDESFTFNARVNRLAPIQEHRMIMKAVQNGVSAERIAAALNRDVSTVKSFLSLMVGIHEEAADLLKEKPISPQAIRALKKVKGMRQIEMVELMISMNDYSTSYVEALVMGTPKEHLADPDKSKRKKGLTSQAIIRLESEMATLEQDFKAVEKTYGENVLNLTLCRAYLKKLVENPKVARFLKARHSEIFGALEDIAAADAI